MTSASMQVLEGMRLPLVTSTLLQNAIQKCLNEHQASACSAVETKKSGSAGAAPVGPVDLWIEVAALNHENMRVTFSGQIQVQGARFTFAGSWRLPAEWIQCTVGQRIR